MNRNNDRPSRTQRHRKDPQEEKRNIYTDPYDPYDQPYDSPTYDRPLYDDESYAEPEDASPYQSPSYDEPNYGQPNDYDPSLAQGHQPTYTPRASRQTQDPGYGYQQPTAGYDQDPYTQDYQDANPTQAASSGRRRRSQAARIRMEDTGVTPDTTIYPPQNQRQQMPMDDDMQQAPSRGRSGRAQQERPQQQRQQPQRAGRQPTAAQPPQERAPQRQRPARKVPNYMEDAYEDDPYDDDPYEDDRYSKPQKTKQRKGRNPYMPPGDDGDEYDTSPYGVYDEDAAPRKKKKSKKWLIILIMILVLVGAGVFVALTQPQLVDSVTQWGRELIGGEPTPAPTLEPTPEPVITPEPLPDLSAATVDSFQADELEIADISEPVKFEIVTSTDTDRVQIVNDNGEEVASGGEGEYVDEERGRVWRLMTYFVAPYEGTVEVYPGNASGWNEASGSSISLKVGSGGGSLQAGAGFQAVPTEVASVRMNRDGEMETYTPNKAASFGSAADYSGQSGMNGVLTFRGSNMRQNAAFGTVEVAEQKLEQVWTAQIGTPSSGANAFGVQPTIVQWHADIRKMMEMDPAKLEKSQIKEVIFPGNDGTVYFYDLDDGMPTRSAITLENQIPMLSTASVYPKGFPLAMIGTGDPAGDNNGNDTGMMMYNLLKNVDIGIIRGNNSSRIAQNTTVITSPLIDNNSDAMYNIGGNGLFYVLDLNSNLDAEAQVFDPKPVPYTYRFGTEGDDTSVENSVAAYGSYAYFASNSGVLQCLDLNTLTPVWALNVGAGTQATIALAERSSGVVLYHATKADVEGLAHLRCIDGTTGDVLWDVAMPGTISASPLVGTGALDGTVYVAVKNPSGGGMIYAMEADTGNPVWEYMLVGEELSSPIALYDESGNAWIVQGDEGGLLLLEAKSGQQLDYLALDGATYGSPAAFDNMIVVATTSGTLHAVRLN